MPASNLHIDVREAVTQCLSWMEAVKMALETYKARAADRKARIDLNALGKFIDEADDALRDLDALIEGLLAGNVAPADDVETAVAALEFYADIRNYEPRKPQTTSVIAREKGKIARDALAMIRSGAGEGDAEESGE